MKKVVSIAVALLLVSSAVGYFVAFQFAEEAMAKNCPWPQECDLQDTCSEYSSESCDHPQGGTGIWVYHWQGTCTVPSNCCGQYQGRTCEYITER